MLLGAAIRQARKAAAMSQEELARGAGISTTAVRAIERGRIASPRIFVMVALANRLGVLLDTLLQDVVRPTIPRQYTRNTPEIDGTRLGGGTCEL